MARISSTFTVTSSDRVSPTIHRVRFDVSDISPFAATGDTDAYVKLLLPAPPRDGDADADADGTVMRTYTVHSIDEADSSLAIDFALHGSGVACAWALAARPGDVIEALGPGGAYSPDPAADHHLLCGDASAIPAIAAAVRALPADAVADVVVEAPSAADADLIPNHPGTATTHVLPQGTPGEALVEMTTAVVAKLLAHGDVDPASLQVFVHGEAHAVMKRIRPLLKESGVTVRGASISGYWRIGRTEEGFREWKRENRPDQG